MSPRRAPLYRTDARGLCRSFDWRSFAGLRAAALSVPRSDHITAIRKPTRTLATAGTATGAGTGKKTAAPGIEDQGTGFKNEGTADASRPGAWRRTTFGNRQHSGAACAAPGGRQFINCENYARH